jgi:hypothetical protein
MVQHNGGCHCGTVRFQVSAPVELTVLECTCSICRMLSYLHLIVSKSQFELERGADYLTTYTFNTGVAQHYFCSGLRREILLYTPLTSRWCQCERQVLGRGNCQELICRAVRRRKTGVSDREDRVRSLTFCSYLPL